MTNINGRRGADIEGLPKCLHPDCNDWLIWGRRGLCQNHHIMAQSLVRGEKVTWAELELAGLANPRPEENKTAAAEKETFLAGAMGVRLSGKVDGVSFEE